MTLRVGGTNLELLSDLMNGGAAIATNNPVANMVGDGVTNNLAAWNSISAAYDYIIIPDGTYLFSAPMVIGDNKTVVGFGVSNTIIKGTSGQASVISITGDTDYVTLRDIGVGGASTVGVLLNNTQTILLDNIHVGPTFTGTNGFSFTSVWASSLTNLYTHGASISNACFLTATDFNGVYCQNWYTSNNAPYNFYIGYSQSCSFDQLAAQGGTIGLFLVSTSQSTVFNSMYQEGVSGNQIGVASTNLVTNTTFNGCSFNGAGGLSCIELEYAYGVTFNSCNFVGCFNAYSNVAVSFSGGGGSGATAIARVKADGTVHSVQVKKTGSGYTSNPNVTLTGNGSGSGATATAARTGDAVTSVTVTAPGSGYPHIGAPASIRYNNCGGIMINSPTITLGNNGPFYATIMRVSGAQSTSRVECIGISTGRSGGASSHPTGVMRAAAGYGYQHYIEELDASGTTVRFSYVPPSI